jgi:hypothetical protein
LCVYHVGINQLQDTKKYKVRIVFSGITSIPNFMQIHPVVFELNCVDRQIDMLALYVFILCTLCEECMKMEGKGLCYIVLLGLEKQIKI